VDASALVRALASGKLGAAGLDVLSAEPLIREEAEIFRSERRDTEADLRALLADHMLLRFPNVIVTPHIAFDTDGALRRIIDTTLENIAAFAQGRPRNVVADSGG
jgi:D-lactate dehydrogenase